MLNEFPGLSNAVFYDYNAVSIRISLCFFQIHRFVRRFVRLYPAHHRMHYELRSEVYIVSGNFKYFLLVRLRVKLDIFLIFQLNINFWIICNYQCFHTYNLYHCQKTVKHKLVFAACFFNHYFLFVINAKELYNNIENKCLPPASRGRAARQNFSEKIKKEVKMSEIKLTDLTQNGG